MARALFLSLFCGAILFGRAAAQFSGPEIPLPSEVQAFGSTPMTLSQPVNGITTFSGSMDILDANTKVVLSTARVTISTDKSIATSFQPPFPLPAYPMKLLVKVSLSAPIPFVASKEVTVQPATIDLATIAGSSEGAKAIISEQSVSLALPNITSAMSSASAVYRLALVPAAPEAMDGMFDPAWSPNLLMGRLPERFAYVLQDNVAWSLSTLVNVKVPSASYPALPRGMFYHFALLARNNASVARTRPFYLGVANTDASSSGPVSKEVLVNTATSLNIGTNIPPQRVTTTSTTSTNLVPALIDLVVHSRPTVLADGRTVTRAIARISNALPLATLQLPTTTTPQGMNVPVTSSAVLNLQFPPFSEFIAALRASMPADDAASMLPATIASYADFGPIRILINPTAPTLMPLEPAIIPQVLAVVDPSAPVPPPQPTGSTPSMTAAPTRPALLPSPGSTSGVFSPPPPPPPPPSDGTGNALKLAVKGLSAPPADDGSTSSATFFPGVMTLGQLIQADLSLILPVVSMPAGTDDVLASAHVDLCSFTASSTTTSFSSVPERAFSCSRITMTPLRLGMATRHFQLRLWPVEGMDKLGGAVTFGSPYVLRARANLTAMAGGGRLRSLELPVFLQPRPKAALRTDPLIPAAGGVFSAGQTFTVSVSLPIGMANPFNADGTMNPSYTPVPAIPPIAVVLMSTISSPKPVRVLAGPEAVRTAMANSPMSLTVRATLTTEDLSFAQIAIWPPPPPPRFWIQVQFPASTPPDGGAAPFTIPAAVLDSDAFIPAPPASTDSSTSSGSGSGSATSTGTIDGGNTGAMSEGSPSVSPKPSASRTAAPSRFPQPSAWPTRPPMPSRSPWPSMPVAPSRLPPMPSASAPPTRRPGESAKPTPLPTIPRVDVNVNLPSPSAAPKLPVMELQLGIKLSSSAKQSSQASTILSRISAAIAGDKVGRMLRDKLGGVLRKDPSQISIASVMETASKKVTKLNHTSPCNRQPRMRLPSSPSNGTNMMVAMLETMLGRMESDEDERPRACVPNLAQIAADSSSTTTTTTVGASSMPDIKVSLAISLRLPTECSVYSMMMTAMKLAIEAAANNNTAATGTSGSSSSDSTGNYVPSVDEVWPEGGASAPADFTNGGRRVLRSLQQTAPATDMNGDLSMSYDGVAADFTAAADTLASADLSDITTDVALNAGVNPADVQMTWQQQPSMVFAPSAASAVTAPTAAPASSSGSSASSGVTAAVVVTSLVVIGALVVGGFYYRRRQRSGGVSVSGSGRVMGAPPRRTSVAGQQHQSQQYPYQQQQGNQIIVNPLSSGTPIKPNMPPVVGTSNPMLFAMSAGVGSSSQVQLAAMMNHQQHQQQHHQQSPVVMMSAPLPGSAASMNNATMAQGQAFKADDAATSRAAFKPFRASFAGGQPGSGARNSIAGRGTSV